MTHPRLDSIAAKLAIVLMAWCAAAVAQNKKTTAIPPPMPPAATTPGPQPVNANRGMLGAPQSSVTLAKPTLLGNDIEQMTQAQFRALPDTALLRYSAELAKKNAQEQAVMDALNNRTKQIESSASYLVLAKEAGDLQRRYSSSNLTQKAQLKQRALEIHNQLLEMELGKR